MDLNKNAKEMATVVETYLEPEVVNLIHDNDDLDKYNNLIKELGMTGQDHVARPEKSPIPFKFMNQSYVNIAKELCPKRVQFKDYNASPVPLEILSLIKLAVDENYFETIEIWYDEKNDDPFAIGINPIYQLTKSESRWSDHEDKTKFRNKKDAEKYISENGLTAGIEHFGRENYYAIGKWGDVARTYEELKELAIVRFKSSCIDSIKRRIKDANRELEDLNSQAFEKFN